MPLLLRLVWAASAVLAFSLLLKPAHAAALDPVGLDLLGVYVSCTERCALGSVAKKNTCVQSCGAAPAAWNKNLDSVVNRKDYQLALLEYMFPAQICYQSGAVVPQGQCTRTCTGSDCQDNDKDGLKAWQEALVGTSDNVAQRLCTTGADCNGFYEQCGYQGVLDLAYCQARATTTAFHLELVEENASEVVAAVVFDYSPVPPTVLDLYVQFNGTALTLTESRPLLAATRSGKSVEVRRVADNVLRVIALGAEDARPVEPGPVAELVFVRNSSDPNSLQFATDPVQRQGAMAPTLGAQQAGLLDNSAWGTAIAVKSSNDSQEGHVLLHYDFESEAQPLAESNAPSAAQACTSLRLSSGQSLLSGPCPNEPAAPVGGPDAQYVASKQIRDRWLSQLSSLQRGTVISTRSLPGVNGLARWLDGAKDHLELPLTFKRPALANSDFLEADQSVSVSFWMLQGSGAKGEQVLFARSDQSSEQTKIALLSRPTAGDSEKFDLVWLNGAISDVDGAALGGPPSSAVRKSIRQALPANKWTHIGLSIDATQTPKKASVFIDGALADSADLVAGALTSCGQIAQPDTARLAIHEEGDFALVKGTGPETLYFGVAANNGLYGIDRMDPSGLGRRPIVRQSDSSARDPDYNPALDRVVYASDTTGNTEIWLANGDGSHARPITNGFGSAADGVFARHPRWAPDGSAIVFESNAYALSPVDNAKSLATHLYYIGYSTQLNDVSIPLANGQTVYVLDYQERVKNGDIAQYRLTRTDEDFDNENPQWLSGKTGTDELKLGELAFTTLERNGSNPRVRRVRIANSYLRGENPAKLLVSYVDDAVLGKLGDDRRLLAAKSYRPAGQPAVERALLAQQTTVKVPAPEVTAVVTAGGACSAGLPFKVSLRYSNPSASGKCWDKNADGACDSITEDRNGDNVCDVLDCNASQLEGIFVGYDGTKTSPVMGAGVVPGAWLTSNAKNLVAKQLFSTPQAVRIEVSSQVNSLPIPDGSELASIQFCGSAPLLTITKQQTVQTLSIVSSVTAVNAVQPVVSTAPFVLADSRLQSVTAAEFSPNVERLALATIFDARPMLFRTATDTNGKALNSTAGADLITNEPVRVEGLSWTGASRFLACNWLGATRSSTTKLYANAFLGALDEVKLVDYVRPAAGYLSEAERGHERLAKEGRDGPIPVQGVSCSVDADCQASELCTAGRCQITTCNPTAATPCARGRCQRLPLAVAPVEQYACVAECAVDANCQDKQCANGPCAVCFQQTHTCGECQSVVQNIGNLKLEYVQGCPDRNSFSCDRGTCVSECYSFDNGQTKYRCDPATEYCRGGKCALFDWNWADLGPMSLTGAGEMVTKSQFVTAAVSQLYPVEIQAFGVSDNALAPEILVEGKAPGSFAGSWFAIGRVKVDNETTSEAVAKPYTLNVPYAITDLRVRMVVPAYENLSGGGAGEFCGAALPSACRFVPPSSRAMLGYEAWIPGYLSKLTASPSSIVPEQLTFLRSGVPSVIVVGLKVNGQTQWPVAGGPNWSNKICPYWNGAMAVDQPVDLNGRPNLLIYGDASREVSNQRNTHYPTAPASMLVPFDAANRGYAVLNCNYVDDGGTPAGLQLPVSGASYPNLATGQLVAGNTTENANGCRVNVSTPDAPRYEPCYEWTGGDVSLDPFANEPQPYRTLTLARFRSFGWGSGSINGDSSP